MTRPPIDSCFSEAALRGSTSAVTTGPMTIRYTAVVKDGVWSETGTRQAPGREPVEFFGMKLQRLGDTDWPAGGEVAP